MYCLMQSEFCADCAKGREVDQCIQDLRWGLPSKQPHWADRPQPLRGGDWLGLRGRRLDNSCHHQVPAWQRDCGEHPCLQSTR